MPIITNEMTKIAYEMAVEVYNGTYTNTEAVSAITNRTNMNAGSAKDYVVGIRKILEGELYKRTFNTYAIDFILSQIQSQFDKKIYRRALSSVDQHVKYYENIRSGGLPSTKAILIKHRRDLNSLSGGFFPEEIIDDTKYIEGIRTTVNVNSFERNIAARQACIQHYGPICNVCDFDFNKFYGDIGKGFIHVHHLVPLADIAESYQVDPINDLRPVCPNCHAMLHQKTVPYSIEELRRMIKSKNR